MNIQSVSKAIGGSIVTALVAYLSSRGIIVNPDISAAISVLIAAIIGFAGVYISPANKE